MKNTPAQNYLQVVRYAKKQDFLVNEYDREDIREIHEPIPQKTEQPSEAEIEAMLTKMHKVSGQRELNCGSCGYDTCREKAAAIIQGKAEISMCLPYMLNRNGDLSDSVVVNFPDAVIVLNEKLEIQRLNTKAKKILRVMDEGDVLGENIGRLLDPEPFEMVMLKKRDIVDEQVYLAEYELYVEQTIMYDSESRQFICVLCDITTEMDLREKKRASQYQAIEIADDMAKKQLKIVQSIASLLGETTSDTLVALERLKEVISND